jgi:hypothetical protein
VNLNLTKCLTNDSRQALRTLLTFDEPTIVIVIAEFLNTRQGSFT